MSRCEAKYAHESHVIEMRWLTRYENYLSKYLKTSRVNKTLSDHINFKQFNCKAIVKLFLVFPFKNRYGVKRVSRQKLSTIRGSLVFGFFINFFITKNKALKDETHCVTQKRKNILIKRNFPELVIFMNY